MGVVGSIVELDTHRMNEKTTVTSSIIHQRGMGEACQDARSDSLDTILDWKRQGVQPIVDEKKKGSTL